MRDDEDKAYYWLLKHESELRLQLFISSAKHLETSCDIFENHFEMDKMIRCYLCLSKTEASLHHKKEAYAWARLASFNFKKYHISKKLSGQLNLAMASFYQDLSNYDTALKYGRLALTDFYTEGSPREVQLSMMQLFMAYADKQMPDSADYYFKPILLQLVIIWKSRWQFTPRFLLFKISPHYIISKGKRTKP